MKNLLFLFFVYFLISCTSKEVSEKQKENFIVQKDLKSSEIKSNNNQTDIVINIDTSALYNEIPEDLKKYIKENIKDYYLPNLKNYIKEWYVFYNEPFHLPYFCKDDFNGDKITDYALILLKNGYEVSFVVINGDVDLGYKCMYIENIGGKPEKVKQIEVGLEIEPKGEIEGLNGKLKLKNNAIILNCFEKVTTLYYWDGKEYKEFPGDD